MTFYTSCRPASHTRVLISTLVYPAIELVLADCTTSTEVGLRAGVDKWRPRGYAQIWTYRFRVENRDLDHNELVVCDILLDTFYDQKLE